jgi:outer membrane protein assembly factor BamB
MVLAMLLAATLSGCSHLPEWMTSAKPIVRAPGERLDVVPSAEALKADAAASEVAIEVPDQTNLEAWSNPNTAMLTAHVGLTGVTREQSAAAGEGNDFSRSVVSSPVTGGGMVFAMDALGIVSAHEEADIRKVKWTDSTGRKKHESDALGGGLAFADGVVYATNGFGNLRALDAASGAVKWSIGVGAPVRGAPAVDAGVVVVLTADNQTLAFDATNGQPRWEHRGIRETAGYFSTTSPVIGEGVVVSVYSSGEVFALRSDSGSERTGQWSPPLAAAHWRTHYALVGWQRHVCHQHQQRYCSGAQARWFDPLGDTA